MSEQVRSYGPAILSLLVAADQRCPAIIGGAHLLYYARFSNVPNDQQTFQQLKRDVADLKAAVDAVEATLSSAYQDVER